MGSLVFQATLGGQVNLNGPNTASTFDIAVPATTGTMVTTGDSGTVTNTMLAGSIANAKLTNSSVTVGSTSIALGATSTTLDGVNIGATTPGTGAFTTLSASSTVSGTGFSTYLASPPAIGGTAAAAGTFTTLSGTTSVTTPIVKSASSLTLQTNGTTTAVTVDTSQNVGIGTTSPVYKLDVAQNSASNNFIGRFINTDTGGSSGAAMIVTQGAVTGLFQAYGNSTVNFGTQTNHALTFQTNSSERMRIDSSGIVGMGTTNLGDTSRLKLVSAVTTNRATSAQLSVARTTASTQYEGICFNTGVTRAAYILRVPNSDDLTFGFDAGGGTSEVMRIDTSGIVMVGTTTTTPAGSGDTKGISLWTNGSSSQIFATGNGDTAAVFNRAGSDGALIRTRRQGSDVGSISVTASATAYNTSSDYRLKEDVIPMAGALSKIAALKPVTYKWKIDGSDGEGFIAHELAEIVPQCVTGAKDAVDADGNPIHQGIDTSFLVATLTAAIQELTARVAALEAK